LQLLMYSPADRSTSLSWAEIRKCVGWELNSMSLCNSYQIHCLPQVNPPQSFVSWLVLIYSLLLTYSQNGLVISF
jgi:hypothetical protein